MTLRILWNGGHYDSEINFDNESEIELMDEANEMMRKQTFCVKIDYNELGWDGLKSIQNLFASCNLLFEEILSLSSKYRILSIVIQIADFIYKPTVRKKALQVLSALVKQERSAVALKHL